MSTTVPAARGLVPPRRCPMPPPIERPVTPVPTPIYQAVPVRAKGRKSPTLFIFGIAGAALLLLAALLLTIAFGLSSALGFSASFNPNNFESTQRWAQKRVLAIRDVSKNQGKVGNEIRSREQLQTMAAAAQTEMRPYIGKEVTWAIPVENVSDSYVALCYEQKTKVRDVINGPLVHFVVYMHRRNVPGWNIKENGDFRLKIGEDIDLQRARQLSKGQTVTVRGTIKETYVGDGMTDKERVIVILTDVRVAP